MGDTHMKLHGMLGVALALALSLTLGAGVAQAQDAAGNHGTLDKLDRNGNGCLDLEEGRNFSSRQFHHLDKDGNGTLEGKEVPPGGDARALTLDAWQDAYSAGFAQADSNGNGCLEPAELQASRSAAHNGGH